MRKLLLATSVVAAVAFAAAPAAQARVFVGIGLGFGFAPFYPYYAAPVYVPPPAYYYPPPVYYYPPPVSYVPPSPAPSTSATSGRTCYAGAYVCPLSVPLPVGGACSCPANVGRAPGRVG